MLISNRGKLFLIDGLGALLTAFFLGIVLIKFEEYFGMPGKVLQPLSRLAFVFAVYSMSCYFFVGKNQRPFLVIIAIANLIYCFITIGLVIVYYESLKFYGMAYFIGEILIICGLVLVEAMAIAKYNERTVSQIDNNNLN